MRVDHIEAANATATTQSFLNARAIAQDKEIGEQ
jgi:hypothetical protein